MNDFIDNVLDEGIKGVVDLLKGWGVDTFSSCQGGGYWNGHGYLRPVVCFWGDDNEGKRALDIVKGAGYKVFQLNRVYSNETTDKEPEYWQIEFISGAACTPPFYKKTLLFIRDEAVDYLACVAAANEAMKP